MLTSWNWQKSSVGKLKVVVELFEGHHFDGESSSCACAGIFDTSSVGETW
jgi:hypothetical protein